MANYLMKTLGLITNVEANVIELIQSDQPSKTFLILGEIVNSMNALENIVYEMNDFIVHGRSTLEETQNNHDV